MPIRIAVDAMGGDYAPAAVVEGVLSAIDEQGEGLEVILVGEEQAIHTCLNGEQREALHVMHAPEVISMHESPASAIKAKTRSSIHIGLGLCRESKADAFVSAGNTGAVMAGSLFILGRLPGVSRPSVIGYYPTLKGSSVLVDAGTNVDCKPEHLVQFAHMGSVFAQKVMGAGNPKVALLNIGEEAGKGNEAAKEAYVLLEADQGINFVGNIEGRDVLAHAADVVVCDGFVGNILLKLGESIASVLPTMIGAEMHRLGMTAEEQQTVARALSGVKARFDYEEYGGAPLLGVAGTVVIGHGGSSAYAIKNLVLAAAKMVRGEVKDSITAALSD